MQMTLKNVISDLWFQSEEDEVGRVMVTTEEEEECSGGLK